MQVDNRVSVQSGGTVYHSVTRCLEDLGGLEKLVPPGKTVLVKPNLVVEQPHDFGATTNPEVVEVILQELLRTSPREIILGDGAATVCSTQKAFQVTGMDKLAEKYGARLVDFQKDRYVKVPVPAGKALDEVQVVRTVREADCIINLPVLKVHAQTKATVSLKNLKGCISDREKKRFHRLNLEQCIADLNTVIPVNLVVVDATVCSFAWEGGGSPVAMDTIVAGTNPVAVDTVAVPLLGYAPREIEHVRLSADHGLGPTGPEEIEIMHREKLPEPPPEEIPRTAPDYSLPGLEVVEKGACTSCLAGVLAALRRLKKEGATLHGSALLGQKLTEEDLEGKKGILLGIGECGAQLVVEEGALPGCPPRGRSVYEFLRRHTS